MTLAATGSPRTTSDAIDVDGGSDTLIENVRITESRGRGIVFDGKDIFAGTPLQASRNVVRDCAISDVPGDGIQLLAASEPTRSSASRSTSTRPPSRSLSQSPRTPGAST